VRAKEQSFDGNTANVVDKYNANANNERQTTKRQDLKQHKTSVNRNFNIQQIKSESQ